MITEIEPSKGSDIFVNLRTETWYRAQKVGGKEGHCDIVRIVEASDGSTTFKKWGVNHDGVIKLYPTSIRRFKGYG